MDVTKDPFNVYISGLDTEGTIDTEARSDVNMIVTVNPQTHRILLTSLPRDAYIDLKSVEAKDKLTHTACSASKRPWAWRRICWASTSIIMERSTILR